MSADPFAPRAELWALLEGAGIAVDHAGGARLAQVPGVVVRAGNPWLTPAGTYRRTIFRSAWDVMAVAGRLDAAAAEQELGDLMAAVTLAIFGATPGAWSSPTWGGMLVFTVDGVDHLTATATVTTAWDMQPDPDTINPQEA